MSLEFRKEPSRVLVSRHDGVEITRRILSGAGGHCTDSGLLLVEMGNSWAALEQLDTAVPFNWLQREHGATGSLP
ncbi:MAG: hypothetical protein HRT77_14325 [Halioglobus sp.]|nr:hypothetical protein [Halioglobus sp.]